MESNNNYTYTDNSISQLFNTLNKRYIFYSNVIIILYLSLILVYVVVSNIYDPGNITLLTSLKLISGMILVIVWFTIVVNSKSIKLVRYSMLDIINKGEEKKLIQDNMLRTFLIFLSIILYTSISLFPMFYFKSNQSLLTEANHIYVYPKALFLVYRQLAGIHLILVILTLVIGYIVIILPKLLELKIAKNQKLEYKYIYWYFFIIHKFNSTPLIHYFLIPIFMVSSLSVILFPFATRNKITISLENLFEVDTFSLLISIISIWLSVLIALINDIMGGYFHLNKSFEDYTTSKLSNNFNSSGVIKYAIIGFGNLSRIINGLLIPQIYNNSKMNIKGPYSQFDIIIDKALNLRIVNKHIIIVEQNKLLFEEIHMNNSNGFSFGFFNGLECINVSPETNHYSENVAILGICGSGENLSILRDIGFKNIDLIINTSSDLDMGLKLKSIIESHSLKHKRTTLISTVEDSTSYSFLEGESEYPLFPLHTGRIEGAAIGNRLFMMYNKSIRNEFNKKKFIIIGAGKAIYYTIETFRRTLKIFDDEATVKDLIENSFTILTIDDNIVQESKKLNNYRLKWNIVFYDGITYQVDIFKADPNKFSSLIRLWDEIKGKDNFETIFILTTPKKFDTLRIAEHMRQLVSLKLEQGISILVSSGHETKVEIDKIIAAIPEALIKNSGFPKEKKDFIISKNEIIGNQIIAMSNFNFINNQISNLSNQDLCSELILCCDDGPLSYIQSLIKLSNFEHSQMSNIHSEIPSFYYSYSYPLLSLDSHYSNSFVFRADAYLTNYSPISNSCSTNSYYINCAKNDRNEIDFFLKNIGLLKNGKRFNCGRFNERCPISSYNKLEKRVDTNVSRQLDSKVRFENLATIKIWADGDDIPGSLALCLADFLMLGAEIRQNSYNRTSVFNVIYEYCSLCSLDNKTIARLYTRLMKIDESVIVKINNLIKNRNIRAIKIKPSNKERKWDLYCNKLEEYLNKICEGSSTRYYKTPESKDDNTILILRNDPEFVKDSSIFDFVTNSL